jgi:predicted phage tail protein
LQYTQTAGVIAGSTYEFKVVAVNAIGNSTPSPGVSIKAAQKPDAPQAPVESAADKTSISITWTAPTYDGSSSITSYNVYWDNNSGTLLSTPVGTTNYQTLSFTKSGLTAGLNYKFAVSAVNDLGESSLSGVVSIISATVPDPVTILSMYSQSKTSIGI